MFDIIIKDGNCIITNQDTATHEYVCNPREIGTNNIITNEPDLTQLLTKAFAYNDENGITRYLINLIKPSFIVVSIDATPEDRVKVEKVIATLDRNVSIEQYKNNLEQAISNAL